MTQQYEVNGMTCGGCVAGVTEKLKKVPGVKNVQVDLASETATLNADRPIPADELQAALGTGKYTVKDKQTTAPVSTAASTLGSSTDTLAHRYEVTGMTCNNCVAGVTEKLKKVPGVKSVNVSLADQEATVEMYRPIPEKELQTALGSGKYTIREKGAAPVRTPAPPAAPAEEESKLRQLYPLFLIFAYLAGAVLLSEMAWGEWDGMRAMQHFMGGFFLVFSFFKFLDLRGFAGSFAMYDPLAKRWLGYGFVYPFIELALGAGFMLGWNLWLLSVVTLVVLGITTVGVAETVLNKRKIKCACLGTVLNLPMTTATLIENAIMIVMATWMILTL